MSNLLTTPGLQQRPNVRLDLALSTRFAVAILAGAAVLADVQAALLAPCVPPSSITAFAADAQSLEKDWAARKCVAENKIYETWEPKLLMLAATQQDMVSAANHRDWRGWKTHWARAMPVLQELQGAAYSRRELPASRFLLQLFDLDLQYLLRNGRLGAAADLQGAAARIAAGLNGPHADRAAVAGNMLVEQSITRSVPFVQALGKTSNADVQKVRVLETVAANSATRNHPDGQAPERHSVSVTPNTRTVWQGLLVLMAIVTGGALWLAGKNNHPSPITVAMSVGLSYAISATALALAYIGLPIVPDWMVVAAILTATSALYFRGERWLDGVAAVSGNSILSRTMRCVGGLLGAGRRLTTSASTNATDAVSRMAAKTPTHGSAHWGTLNDMARGGHLALPGQGVGFTLGRVPGAPQDIDPRFWVNTHNIVVAPTGSGKGIGTVTPNLLEYPGSIMVLDVKGENAAVTAAARRAMGHEVFVVDPFRVVGEATHGFNLLSRMNPHSANCVPESAMLADALVMMTAKGGGEHFEESAKTLLQGLMLHVVASADPHRRTLGEMRRLLTTDADAFFGTITDMIDDPEAAFGLPARAANTFMGMADRERGSVLSTARRHTAFLDDPRIADVLARSDIDFARIKTELITVYLVLPANQIGPNARLVRGFINAVIAAATASAAPPVHPVAFLLDEFGQLGYMQSIENAVSLMRGYGLLFWLFIQDLSQLKGVYPKWQTFLANSAKTFYGIADIDTAKYVSESLGNATISYDVVNESEQAGSSMSGRGGSFSSSSSSSTSRQHAARALLTPTELMSLGAETPIVLLRGEPPYKLERLNYLTDPLYAGKAAANPYYQRLECP